MVSIIIIFCVHYVNKIETNYKSGAETVQCHSKKTTMVIGSAHNFGPIIQVFTAVLMRCL